MQYELEFKIGEECCVLLDIQSGGVLKRAGKYYEHYHPCFEFHYVTEGEVVYLCQGNVLTLRCGDLLIIPPRMYHKAISSPSKGKKISFALDIPISGTTLDTKKKYLCDVFSCDRAMSVSLGDGLVKDEIMRLSELASIKDQGYVEREKIRAAAHSFTVNLYDFLSEEAHRVNDVQNDSDLSREYEIDTFMALNFTSGATMEALAEQLHVSVRQAHRIIKKSYGKTYREKAAEIRLEIALGFLRATDKSISEIAEELGYSSSSSFTTFIKNETGKTPTAIRRGGSVRKKNI